MHSARHVVGYTNGISQAPPRPQALPSLYAELLGVECSPFIFDYLGQYLALEEPLINVFT